MPRAKVDFQNITTLYEEKVAASVRQKQMAKINNNSLSLIQNINDDMKTHIGEVLREGVEAGRSVAATASKLLATGLDRGVFMSARKRVWLIARTELHRARQQAAYDIYYANDIKKVKWIAVGDERTCSICGPRNNHVYALSAIREENPVPAHPRCRCRLVPADFKMDIKVKRSKKGKVLETKFSTTPQDYKYIIKLEKSDYDFSSTQVELPNIKSDIDRILKKIDPADIHPTEKQNDNYHITVRYGLLIDDSKAMEHALEYVDTVHATFEGIDVFQPKDRDYDVLVMRVDSPDLWKINYELGKMFPNETEFPNYQPHMTICYLKRDTGKKYTNLITGLEDKQLIFDNIVFSPADGEKVSIDLEKSLTKRIIKSENMNYAELLKARTFGAKDIVQRKRKYHVWVADGRRIPIEAMHPAEAVSIARRIFNLAVSKVEEIKELEKAIPYMRVKRGKLEHVKGYPHRPRLWDVSPEKRIERALEPYREDVKIANRVAHEIAALGGKAFIVGGFVRDAILGKTSKDIDLEVYGIRSDELRTVLEGIGKVDAVGASFGVFKITTPEIEEAVDISVPRRDSKIGEGHKGFVVEADPSMSVIDAARRRDLTINSIAYDPITKTIVDEYHGVQDLKDRKLRAVDPATFVEDPLRVLRVMQFAGRFEMVPDVDLIKLCRTIDLTSLPKERLYTEFEKLLLKSKMPSIGLRLIPALGIDKIFPEIEALKGVQQDKGWHPEGPVWKHTLMVVDAAARKRKLFENKQDKMVLMLSALCHDMGKPTTTEVNEEGHIISHGHEAAGVEVAGKFLDRITNENDIIERVMLLVGLHMSPTSLYDGKAGNSGIRRLARKVDIPMLVALSIADKEGRGIKANLKAERWLMQKYKALKLTNPETLDPKVKGRDLIPLGVQPGPGMGAILKQIYEGQLEGKFDTTEGGLEYAKELGLIQKSQVKGFTRTRRGKLEFVKPFEREGQVQEETQFDSILAERTNIFPSLYHNTDTEDFKQFEEGKSRWGHEGTYFFDSLMDAKRFLTKGQRLVSFKSSFKIFDIKDEDNGSFDIKRGYTNDTKYMEIAKHIAKKVGLGEPPWNLPPKAYGIEYFRNFDKELKNFLASKGFDGWMMGAELVVWNYKKLNDAPKYDWTRTPLSLLKQHTGAALIDPGKEDLEKSRRRGAKDKYPRKHKLEAEIKDLQDEMEEKTPLLHTSYDRLADGSRAKPVTRKIDPETESSIRKWLAKSVRLSFFVDKDKSRKELVSFKKSQNIGKKIPYRRDDGKIVWGKLLDKGILIKADQQHIDYDTKILIKSQVARITGIGKDGVVARTEDGTKHELLYKDLKYFLLNK